MRAVTDDPRSLLSSSSLIETQNANARADHAVAHSPCKRGASMPLITIERSGLSSKLRPGTFAWQAQIWQSSDEVQWRSLVEINCRNQPDFGPRLRPKQLRPIFVKSTKDFRSNLGRIQHFGQIQQVTKFLCRMCECCPQTMFSFHMVYRTSWRFIPASCTIKPA